MVLGHVLFVGRLWCRRGPGRRRRLPSGVDICWNARGVYASPTAQYVSSTARTLEPSPASASCSHADAVADHIADRNGDNPNLQIGKGDDRIVEDGAEDRGAEAKQACASHDAHSFRRGRMCRNVCAACLADRLSVDVEVLDVNRALTCHACHPAPSVPCVWRRDSRDCCLELQGLGYREDSNPSLLLRCELTGGSRRPSDPGG